jgi:predicted O-methyltransferase YrrM
MLELPKALKDALKAIAPRTFYPSSLLRRSVRQRTSSKIVGGPFRGMTYLAYSTYGAYIAKLIGTYEREVASVLETELSQDPRHVIDVGGAEGYYAVGVLTRVPNAKVTVFEMAEAGRRAIGELARLNGVSDRVDVRGRCDPEALEACLASTGATFVIVDVEGFEAELLDPRKCPSLAQADLLVEVHDFKVPGCSQTVLANLASTHRATIIRQSRRDAGEYPFRSLWPRLFPGAVVKYGLNEFRPADNWWIWFQRNGTVTEGEGGSEPA